MEPSILWWQKFRDQLVRVQQVQATRGAFAAILADGSVVTWGDPSLGGNSASVEDRLNGMVSFAAFLADGSVVGWGESYSNHSCHQLRNLKSVKATCGAFAAGLSDGSVAAGGNPGYGGDRSAVQHQLKNVHQQIWATSFAFAAILADGSLVVRGDPDSGGDCSKVQDQLANL